MSDKEVIRIRGERKEQFADDPNNPQQLPIIANEIRVLVGNFKRDIYEIGKLLTKAKRLVGHGKFKKWIRKNFDFSYQAANNFMRIYDCCLEQPQLVKTIKSSVLSKIASPKFPRDLREFLFKNGNYLENITNAKIKKIMERYFNKEIDLESDEIRGLIKYKKNMRRYNRYQKKIDRNIRLLRKLRDTVLKITEEIEWSNVSTKERPELTKDRKKEIETIIKDIAEAVNKTQPDFEIVKSLKPKLKTA